ncbi:unnamed protein product [Absidia cylindrospora]
MQDSFPIEIISLILHHVQRRDLFTCALVNQRFYQATTSIVWRSLIFANDASLCNGHHHHRLGQHVHHLHVGIYLNGITFDEINSIKTNQPITDTHFQQWIRECPHLTSVCLENSGITQASLKALIQHCGPRLRRLGLKSCLYLSPDVYLPSLVAACPLLEDLDITASSSLWTERALTSLLQHPFSHLTRFAIDGAPLWFLQRVLSVAGGWAPHLTCLHIDSGYGLGDDDIIPFLKTHRKLKDITLIAGQYTDATLDAMRHSLLDLGRVDLAFTYTITHRGVRDLVLHCPRLTFMDLHSCYGVKASQFPEAHGDCISSGDGGAADADLCHLDQDTMRRIRTSKRETQIGLD